ncbi:Hypothetical protein ABZS17D1_00976 [Kosakonia cowanii]
MRNNIASFLVYYVDGTRKTILRGHIFTSDAKAILERLRASVFAQDYGLPIHQD